MFSSYWYLQHPGKRPAFLDLSGCLGSAGGLADTSVGRKRYRDYLAWLSCDAGARKEMLFDRMCRGWAIGSKQFKKDLLSEEGGRLKAEGGAGSVVAGEHYDGRDLREANTLKWELLLERGLSELAKDRTEIREELKSAQ
ncbi:MAG: hypothetical protein GVY36_01930 [Verrucomicrobia bacterium]|nr:hypothetical protein [Verrucomicrobiota bacterium]